MSIAAALTGHSWPRQPSTFELADASGFLARALGWMLVPSLSLHTILEVRIHTWWLPRINLVLPYLLYDLDLLFEISLAGMLMLAWWWWIPWRTRERAERSVSEALSTLVWSCLISALATFVLYFRCLPVWIY
jgi:hypothetical protein